MTQPSANDLGGGIAPTSPAPGDEELLRQLASATSGERYANLRPHARGGLGEVFRAADTELGREVALKRIQERHRGNPESLRRFLFEAAITARLEHPGIVPIHGLVRDADGQPSYAMRFIEGESLDAAIKNYHQGKGPEGERRVRFRQLLQKFLTVCQTMSFAHSRGVIHRDLKPANVMLGPFGETLVVDWGLAKEFERSDKSRKTSTESAAQSTPASVNSGLPETAANSTSGTETGQALGTPQYMAPEQAAGQWDLVGPCSDTYSLGAILYVLLTGRAPFRGSTPLEVLEEVRGGVFPPPHKLESHVPKPLEAICLKAMALKPEDRYGTASALADDLEHWLADEPVTAWREPWTLRARRWMRRHRTVVAMAGMALIAGALMLGVVAWLLHRHNLALVQEQQQTEAARAAEARRRSETRATLDAMTSQVLEELFTETKSLKSKHRDFWRAVLAKYRSFAADTGDTEETRAGVAQAYSRVGYILMKLGESADAQPALREAISRFEELASEFATARHYTRSAASAHGYLGRTHQDRGEAAAAEAEFRAAVHLFRSLLHENEDDPEIEWHLHSDLNALGLLLSHQHKFQEAAAVHQEAMAIAQGLASKSPTNPRYRENLALSQSNVAQVKYSLTEYGQALEFLRAAEQTLNQLTMEFTEEPDYRKNLGGCQNGLGSILALMGRHEEALKSFQSAVVLFLRLAAEFPNVPEYRNSLGGAYFSAAYSHQAVGNWSEAEEAYRQCQAINTKLAADYPGVVAYRDGVANGVSGIAVVESKTNRLAEAATGFEEAMRLRRRLADDYPRHAQFRQDLARTQLNLAAVLSQLGKAEEAGKVDQQASETIERLVADFPTVPGFRELLVRTCSERGIGLEQTGRSAEAEQCFRRGVRAGEALVAEFPQAPQHRLELANCYDGLGVALKSLGRLQEAQAVHRKAIEHLQDLIKASPNVQDLAVALGGAYCNLANTVEPLEALDALTKAIATFEPVVARDATHRPGRQYFITALGDRAKALHRLGRYTEATKDLDRVIGLDSGDARFAWQLLRTECLARAGDHANAVTAAEELLKLKDVAAGAVYDLACVCALASAAVRRDAKLQDQYAARAVELLRQAVAKGYKDIEHLKKDDDLKALRDREDFKKLLKEFESAKEPLPIGRTPARPGRTG